VDVDGRDPERAPMPWRSPAQGGPGAGFTTAEPCLVGAAPDVFCFERQLDQRFLVALNFSSRRVPLALADDARGPAVLDCPPVPNVSTAPST